MLSFIIFLLILGVLVLIHEFGHFFAAKKGGVKVLEFGFGFPPKILWKKIGETIYSINAIPLGGFVQMFGEEYEDIESKSIKDNTIQSEAKQKAFVYKPPHIKTIIVLAGIFMNIMLGVSIYYFLLSTNGFNSDPIPLLSPYNFRFGSQTGRVVASQVVKDSPAQKAGIKIEDLVLAYKRPVDENWENIGSAQNLINKVKTMDGQVIMLEIENVRNGEQKIVSVVPRMNKKLNRAIIGVNLMDAAILSYTTPTDKIFSGFFHSYNIMAYNFSTIKQLFDYSVKEKNIETVSQAVSGPIGIFSVINKLVKSSGKKLVTNLLNIMALLSLSLGVMNLLPFPALDGGRMVFVLYEWITGKKTHRVIERYVNFFGFLFLIIVGILVSINDIIRILK